MFHRLLCVGLVCSFGLGLMGCGSGGPDLSKVKGKVTYKGQAVTEATVTFMPTSGPLATGITDANGEFTLTTGGNPGAVTGEHKIAIVKVDATGQGTQDISEKDTTDVSGGYGQMFPGQGDGAESPAAPKSEIPEKYNNPETSGLTKTVSSNASENEFEFVLTD